MNHHIGEVILDEESIVVGVSRVAKQLNNDHTDAVIITAVPGGTLCIADLTRKLKFDVSTDYMSCPHTPGERDNNSTIVYHQNIEAESHHVILIDDAIESSGTIKRLIKHILGNFNPASLSITIPFIKSGRVSIPVKQYFAYETRGDSLLIGCGMPWDNKYRNRPNITELMK